MFNLQYAGFLAIILVIELAIAASLYAYKDHLADGLHKGLNQSIHKYGPDAVMKSADFDAMQANVSTKHKTFSLICTNRYFFIKEYTMVFMLWSNGSNSPLLYSTTIPFIQF